MNDAPLISAAHIAAAVADAVASQPVADVHTHLYPPSFGTPAGAGPRDPAGLMLWGIDELLTFHYLIAEAFRAAPMPYETFWAMPKAAQADHIWQTLFVERTPISEAARGVVTTLTRLGLDPAEQDLSRYRAWYAEQRSADFLNRILTAANVQTVAMTNNVFDDAERRRWLADPQVAADPRFPAVVRLDLMLTDWRAAAAKLCGWGYACADDPDAKSVEAARRFLREWINRTRCVYCAASLPPTWQYPDGSPGGRALEEIVLPECRAAGLPLALMVGVRRAVNPALRDAGDAAAPADLSALSNLCVTHPHQRLLVTYLSREDQHGLAVLARKFPALTPFGCWWFLNTPSMIDEITRMRLDLLGLTFIPQHSDCRVLEQLLYKWDHSRAVLSRVLADRYAALHVAGWPVTAGAIRRDVAVLLRENPMAFLRR